MKRILLLGMMCAIIVSSVDAATRGRRSRRRASRQSTTQSYARNYSNNYRYNYYRPSTNTTASTNYATQPATTQVMQTTTQAVTAYKPVVSETPDSPTVVAMADSLPDVEPTTEVTPISTAEAATNDVVQATAIEPIPDVLPNLKSEKALSASEPFCASCTVIPAGQSFNSALAELNSIRASRGLPALIEDSSLSAIAYRKASIQANAGAMYHPGGSMGSARYEGVGMGPRFTTCYQNATNVRYAGAATVVGRNGQRFHCLLVR